MREHIRPARSSYQEIQAASRAPVTGRGPCPRWRPQGPRPRAGPVEPVLPSEKLAPGLSTAQAASPKRPGAASWPRGLLGAPDTGNMEVLWKYGTDAQKERWLQPLLATRHPLGVLHDGARRRVLNATNMEATAVRQGAMKSSSTAPSGGPPAWATLAKVTIFMATCRTPGDRHHRHSMVLVPLDAPRRQHPPHAARLRRLRRPTATARSTSRTCACPCQHHRQPGHGLSCPGRLGWPHPPLHAASARRSGRWADD